MANNQYPWMKHDHNARNDDFIKRACGRFGHFGYSGWFRLLETLHEHGSGDNLCMTRARLSKELGSKWPTSQIYLGFCQDSGKITFDDSGIDVRITVKNFRKKQDKKISKTEGDKAVDGLKPALDVDVEVEVDKDRLGFLKILNGVTAKVAGWRYTASALEDHRFPFGKERGRRIVDLEPSRCQFYLDRIQMDAKTTAALRHRIKIKAQESIRK